MDIISNKRELDLTQCFEHAVLLPVPLAIAIVTAIAQIISKTRRLKRPNAKDGLRWIERSPTCRKVNGTKIVSLTPVTALTS